MQKGDVLFCRTNLLCVAKVVWTVGADGRPIFDGVHATHEAPSRRLLYSYDEPKLLVVVTRARIYLSKHRVDMATSTTTIITADGFCACGQRRLPTTRSI